MRKKTIMEERVPIQTMVTKEIRDNFHIECRKNGKKAREVLNEFIWGYIKKTV